MVGGLEGGGSTCCASNGGRRSSRRPRHLRAVPKRRDKKRILTDRTGFGGSSERTPEAQMGGIGGEG